MYSYHDNNMQQGNTGAMRRTMNYQENEEKQNNLQIQNNSSNIKQKNNILNSLNMTQEQIDLHNEHENYWFFFIIFGIIQIIIILLVCLFYSYDYSNRAKNATDKIINEAADYEIQKHYGIFQEVHIMVFCAFGLLYSFLKHYSWTGIAITMVCGVIGLEWGLFTILFFHNILKKKEFSEGAFNFESLINAEFNAATCLVSIGALLGKLTFPHYIIFVLVESILNSLNYILCEEVLGALDAGGSLYVHTFGAFFGVFAAITLFCNDIERNKLENEIIKKHQSSGYYSSITAALGTIILWVYWPSFNTALIDGNMRYRGIINTYLSLCGSILGTCIIGPILNDGKFSIEQILNSSFAGGIIIGGSCNICGHHWAALSIGTIGGIISVFCFKFVGPALDKLGLKDTAGILNIHGIPGFCGGIVTPIAISLLNKEPWHSFDKNEIFIYTDRSYRKQASIQVAALFITFGIAAAGGFLAGFLLRICKCPKKDIYFTDSEYFENENDDQFPDKDDTVNEASSKNNNSDSQNNSISGSQNYYQNNNPNEMGNSYPGYNGK